MKKRMISAFLAAVLLISLLTGCGGKDAAVTTGALGVLHDTDFGNTYIDLTIEEFGAIFENVEDFLLCLCEAEKGTDLNTLDLKAGAENYLRRGGLGDGQIAAVEDFITKFA